VVCESLTGRLWYVVSITSSSTNPRLLPAQPAAWSPTPPPPKAHANSTCSTSILRFGAELWGRDQEAYIYGSVWLKEGAARPDFLTFYVRTSLEAALCKLRLLAPGAGWDAASLPKYISDDLAKVRSATAQCRRACCRAAAPALLQPGRLESAAPRRGSQRRMRVPEHDPPLTLSPACLWQAIAAVSLCPTHGHRPSRHPQALRDLEPPPQEPAPMILTSSRSRAPAPQRTKRSPDAGQMVSSRVCVWAGSNPAGQRPGTPAAALQATIMTGRRKTDRGLA
jgi:hypothetical protein